MFRYLHCCILRFGLDHRLGQQPSFGLLARKALFILAAQPVKGPRPTILSHAHRLSTIRVNRLKPQATNKSAEYIEAHNQVNIFGAHIIHTVPRTVI